MNKRIITFLLYVLFAGPLLSQTAPSLLFSSVPFSGSPKISTEFVWGTEIYGKLTMPKPLKNYARALDNYEAGQLANKSYKSALNFMVCPSSEDPTGRVYELIKLVLSESDLEGKTVLFDVMPSEERASSLFYTGFYSELAKSKLIKYDPSEGTSTGTKTEFNIYLFDKELKYGEDETLPNNSVKIANTLYIPIGKLIIDFTSVKDVREVMQWHDNSRAITDQVAEKFKIK